MYIVYTYIRTYVCTECGPEVMSECQLLQQLKDIKHSMHTCTYVHTVRTYQPTYQADLLWEELSTRAVLQIQCNVVISLGPSGLTGFYTEAHLTTCGPVKSSL